MIQSSIRQNVVPAVRATTDDLGLLSGIIVAVFAATVLAFEPLPGVLPALDGLGLAGLAVYGVILWSLAWRLLISGRTPRA